MNWLAIALGASCGAWLRWGISLRLNILESHFPVGTLVANLTGGYLIGLAVAFFGGHPGLSPEWRLFAITGFLGGLTTFSSFSAESMVLLQRGQYAWAFTHVAMHVLGSIGFCIAGFATYRTIAG